MSQIDIETSTENRWMEDGPFRKNIKLEHDIISEKLPKKFPNVDISDYEMKNFLLIFQELIVLCNSDEEFSNFGDGITEILFWKLENKSIICLIKILFL